MVEPADRPDGPNRLLTDKQFISWAMYDWANSAYTTLVITVLVAYIQRVVFPNSEWGTTGAVVWAWGISLSMFLGALLSPIIGAIADAQGSKRRWLAITALSGSAASILLGLVPPHLYILIVALFVFANLMLELSLGIYNGFLPEIVDEKDLNSASAWGYGLGYLGGGIALLIAMIILGFGDRMGLPTIGDRLRCSLIVMGLWWGLFSLPALLVLRDPHQPGKASKSIAETIQAGGSDVWQTIRGLRRNVPLAFFLLSFLFYNDGIQTVISQASTFALQELSFPAGELMAVILMIQFLAIPGSIVIGRSADLLGQKPTLLGCLLVWGGVLGIALLVETRLGFWWLAAAIAFVLGGTQSVSRSLMATLIPTEQNAQYFGFFNLSGKATSFLGTFLFGAIVAITGSSRLAVFGLLPLFLIGGLLMLRVRVTQPSKVMEKNS